MTLPSREGRENLPSRSGRLTGTVGSPAQGRSVSSQSAVVIGADIQCREGRACRDRKLVEGVIPPTDSRAIAPQTACVAKTRTDRSELLSDRHSRLPVIIVSPANRLAGGAEPTGVMLPSCQCRVDSGVMRGCLTQIVESPARYAALWRQCTGVRSARRQHRCPALPIGDRAGCTLGKRSARPCHDCGDKQGTQLRNDTPPTTTIRVHVAPLRESQCRLKPSDAERIPQAGENLPRPEYSPAKPDGTVPPFWERHGRYPG